MFYLYSQHRQRRLSQSRDYYRIIVPKYIYILNFIVFIFSFTINVLITVYSRKQVFEHRRRQLSMGWYVVGEDNWSDWFCKIDLLVIINIQ